MQYKVVTAGSQGNAPENALAMLSQRVNEAIEDGWKPHGGVSFPPLTTMAPGSSPFTAKPQHFIYACQAMVKD